MWNFIQYNVMGGGESALYGVENWSYYLRNGLNNFNIVFLLAALLPVVSMHEGIALGERVLSREMLVGRMQGEETACRAVKGVPALRLGCINSLPRVTSTGMNAGPCWKANLSSMANRLIPFRQLKGASDSSACSCS